MAAAVAIDPGAKATGGDDRGGDGVMATGR